MAPPFTKSVAAALVAALAVASAAAADPSRKMELTADAATAEMELGFDSEGARRRALQGEYGDVPPTTDYIQPSDYTYDEFDELDGYADGYGYNDGYGYTGYFEDFSPEPTDDGSLFLLDPKDDKDLIEDGEIIDAVIQQDGE